MIGGKISSSHSIKGTSLSRYARNSSGQSGAVPASYVEMITDNPPEEVIPSDVIEYPSSY